LSPVAAAPVASTAPVAAQHRAEQQALEQPTTTDPAAAATNTAVPDERICSRRSSASPSVNARSADESTYTGSLRNPSAASATGSLG
jgi:hypothetical protein